MKKMENYVLDVKRPMSMWDTFQTEFKLLKGLTCVDLMILIQCLVSKN